MCLCLCNPLSLSQLFILLPESAGEHAALHRQRSLPHRPPVIPLVARMADQNTSGTPAMTEREASRLDKFRQLLAGPNTDLGKTCSSSLQFCQSVTNCGSWFDPVWRVFLSTFFLLYSLKLSWFGFVSLPALAFLTPSVSCAALLTMLQVCKSSRHLYVQITLLFKLKNII